MNNRKPTKKELRALAQVVADEMKADPEFFEKLVKADLVAKPRLPNRQERRAQKRKEGKRK